MKVFLSVLLLSALTLVEASTPSSTLNHVLAEINNELPPHFKEVIGEQVKISIRDLNKTTLTSYSCDKNIIVGQLVRKEIRIDPILLKELEKGDRLINCPEKANRHATFKDYLKATIVHELAHLYDKEKRASKNHHFMNISGWMRKGNIIKRRVNLNSNEERSPDHYEFKNPAETFAVNFEHYLYDESFGCRRPVLFEYFNNEFQVENKKLNCRMDKNIYVSSSSDENFGMNKQKIELDINRLYEVHYLLAGKGEQLMSRFGHSMFRLVFCAPDKEVGPHCLNDITHHVVVSYRASIDEMNINYLDGVKGEYPSNLHFMKLPAVIDEYTKGELREIRSIPLRLTKDENQRFLYKTLESFWSYSGKYYFFTNNCATESMNLLRAAMLDNSDMSKKVINSPIGMYNYLIKKGIADASVFNDLTEATRRGHYYHSSAPKLEDSLKFLGIKVKSVENFILTSSALERRKMYEVALSEDANRIRAAANALRIEENVLYMRNLAFMKNVGAKIFEEQNDELLEEIKEFTQNIQSDIPTLSGYGIPLEGEVDSAAILETKVEKGDFEEFQNKLLEFLNERHGPELHELKKIQENRAFLIKQISNR